MQAGKAIVLGFAALLAAAALLFAAYAAHDASLPPETLLFERAQAPANATVASLDYKAVHAAYFLQDHLDTALDAGHSEETVRLRVDAMRQTLRGLTGSDGPQWWVLWDGAAVRVTLSGAAGAVTA